MPNFVRFIFAVLLAGMLVNLGIVLLANTRTQRRQQVDIEEEKAGLQKLVHSQEGWLRRVDVVVEKQTLARGQVVESTLLLRQYASPGSDESEPLHVVRVTIPKDQLTVEGMVLKFSPDFASDSADYQFLCNATIPYFTFVYGRGQTAPDKGPDDRFSFTPRDAVPELTRLHPYDARPSYFEIRLWQYIWDLIPERSIAGAPQALAQRGIAVIRSAPVTQAVQDGHVYSAFINGDGVISIEKTDRQTIPGLQDAMESEARSLLDESTSH